LTEAACGVAKVSTTADPKRYAAWFLVGCNRDLVGYDSEFTLSLNFRLTSVSKLIVGKTVTEYAGAV